MIRKLEPLNFDAKLSNAIKKGLVKKLPYPNWMIIKKEGVEDE